MCNKQKDHQKESPKQQTESKQQPADDTQSSEPSTDDSSYKDSQDPPSYDDKGSWWETTQTGLFYAGLFAIPVAGGEIYAHPEYVSDIIPGF